MSKTYESLMFDFFIKKKFKWKDNHKISDDQ